MPPQREKIATCERALKVPDEQCPNKYNKLDGNQRSPDLIALEITFQLIILLKASNTNFKKKRNNLNAKQPVMVAEWTACLLTMWEVSKSNPGNLPLLQMWHVGNVTGCHAVYTLIQCTPLLVEKAGITPVVTFRITVRKQERVQARYPLWL